MKLAKTLLALSLLANAALATAWWWPRSVPAPVAAPARPAAPAKAPAPTYEQELAAALAADPDFVDAVKTGDPKRLREALIRAGFPADYVRDMVTFFTGSTVSPEHLALLRMQAARPFWKITPGAEELALKKMLRERETKNGDLTKEAFGGKVPPHPLEAQNQQRRYRFLPEDKIARVAGIDSDYNEKLMATRGASGDEGREKARLAAAEKREALTSLLTPAELELYDLNVSPTAMNLRSLSTFFQPTEAEFRGIYDIRRGLDEKYGSYFGSSTQAEMQQRATEQKAVDDRVRSLLGDQRYDEYTRAQDFGYRAAVDIAAHFNLPPATAAQAYAVQQELVKRWSDASSSPDAKVGAAALLAEANTRLTALLGPAGYDAYKKTGGRLWMTGVERVANPPAPAAGPRR